MHLEHGHNPALQEAGSDWIGVALTVSSQGRHNGSCMAARLVLAAIDEKFLMMPMKRKFPTYTQSDRKSIIKCSR
jgi:hypothetical protein